MIRIYLELKHVHLLLFLSSLNTALRFNLLPNIWLVDPVRLDPLPLCLHFPAVHYFVQLDFHVYKRLHVSLLTLN